MSRNKKQALSKPLMVRLEPSMKEEIERIAAANDLSASDIIRLACRRQLVSLRAGRTNLQAS